MAAWITHLRVAEKLLASGVKASEEPFFVGNIAPDSGREIASFVYEPPKEVTHWHKKCENRLESNKMFYDKYVKKEKDGYKYSFYLGYFAHILTDTFFVCDKLYPIMEANTEVWKKNPWAIKGDWVCGDYVFIKNHPGYHPFEVICNVKSFDNVYFNYFSDTDLIDQILRVKSTFSGENPEPERQYLYMNAEALTENVEYCVKNTLDIFGKLNII